jgi:UDPglucose 6-dehydrogenase
MRIGFIGQGWIGKNYADDFENRGYDVVRYSLEPQYVGNKDAIAECDITFVAVPTPTKNGVFKIDYVRDALKSVGQGKIAVIKSTIVPGTTEMLQKEYPAIILMHSPEFLVEKTAAYDAAHPNRNIVGIPEDTPLYREKAEEVLKVLAPAPFSRIMHSSDAEFVKYAGNCYLFTKVMFMNLLYDLVESRGGDWDAIRDAFVHDPRIGESHTQPVHDGGRGAGGDCFIKDFEAFRTMYGQDVGDERGMRILEAEAHKNIELLARSGKSINLLEEVYGDISAYR